MTTKIKWTREKLEILSNEVRKSPDNLQNAFRKMSKSMGVSPGTISTIWYTKGRKLSNDFAIGSEKKVYVNRKNSPKKKPRVVISTKKRMSFLHEKVISIKMVDGIKVVTTNKYYA
jgi:hypothetical protein